MRILITGAAGLLGREVVDAARTRGHEVVATARETLDVTDPEAAAHVLANVRPGAVVHCAAYTAVDRAEDDPELALRVNRDGTAHVAAAAAGAGARFVTISSDYVFDGASDGVPYRPQDPPHPLSVYGRSKLEGERAALASSPGTLVVRTSWLYGAGGPSFVTGMLERARSGAALRVVNDQRGRPTWTRNAAACVLDLLHRRARGIWHVADGGDATWLDLAREAFRLRGVGTPLGPVSTEAWGARAPRPRYSVLDVSGTEALLGRPMTHWRAALACFLGEPSGGEGSGGERSLGEAPSGRAAPSGGMPPPGGEAP